MHWIVFIFVLELGIAPMYSSLNVVSQETYENVTQNIGYVQFEVEATLWDFIFIGGAIKTYVQETTIPFNYHPFEDNYIFNSGFRFDVFEIGWRHLCLHPVRPYIDYYQPQQDSNGFYDEFYLKISNKF